MNEVIVISPILNDWEASKQQKIDHSSETNLEVESQILTNRKPSHDGTGEICAIKDSPLLDIYISTEQR